MRWAPECLGPRKWHGAQHVMNFALTQMTRGRLCRLAPCCAFGSHKRSQGNRRGCRLHLGCTWHALTLTHPFLLGYTYFKQNIIFVQRDLTSILRYHTLSNWSNPKPLDRHLQRWLKVPVEEQAKTIISLIIIIWVFFKSWPGNPVNSFLSILYLTATLISESWLRTSSLVRFVEMMLKAEQQVKYGVNEQRYKLN